MHICTIEELSGFLSSLPLTVELNKSIAVHAKVGSLVIYNFNYVTVYLF